MPPSKDALHSGICSQPSVSEFYVYGGIGISEQTLEKSNVAWDLDVTTQNLRQYSSHTSANLETDNSVSRRVQQTGTTLLEYECIACSSMVVESRSSMILRGRRPFCVMSVTVRCISRHDIGGMSDVFNSLAHLQRQTNHHSNPSRCHSHPAGSCRLATWCGAWLEVYRTPEHRKTKNLLPISHEDSFEYTFWGKSVIIRSSENERPLWAHLTNVCASCSCTSGLSKTTEI